MIQQFDILKKNRIAILSIIKDYSIEQLNKIPDGFKNNIGWNVAHLVVTQQLLCYNMSGVPMLVSDEMVAKFRKGTAPLEDISRDEFEEIKKLFIELPKKFIVDYTNELFKTYNSYTTSLNVSLSDIDSAIGFNNFHEGIHLGIILSLRKFI